MPLKKRKILPLLERKKYLKKYPKIFLVGGQQYGNNQSCYYS
nr:MAG TPA: hypothetical protein [Caudoviricetes sp.]